MISEMLKVRDGRIRRILARTSTLSVTRNVARGEAGLSNCGANGRAFQGCVRFKKLAAALALDVAGRTVARESAVKQGETKEATLATARFVSQDMLTDSFFPLENQCYT